MPAVTVNRVGKGRVYYVGASAEDAFYDDLVARLADEVGIAMRPLLPTAVEVLERVGPAGRILIVTNFSGQPQSVDIGDRGKDLLGKGTVGPKIDLEPYGVRVLKA
jgi:beta-galactosidase